MARPTLAALLALLPAAIGAQEAAPRRVAHCTLTGTVDAGSAAYLRDCVRTAEERGDVALLVRVDTPGGSLEATRQIASAFLASRVPVLVWVGPSGARAGSAGVFITLSAHYAAMAPGTNIGAAHPVLGPGGADPEAAGSEAARKAVNDAVAFAEAIARQRGRNAEWAAKAVRESASVAADEAVRLEVVDALASSEAELLADLDGVTIALDGERRRLETSGAELAPLSPSVTQRVVHWLANPAVAYILFLLGGLGLAIELSNPGLIAPGVIGLVCLVLAMVAFAALPIQAGAVVLLVLGVVLIVAEVFVASGLLGLGGAALIALGGVLLVDRFDPGWFVEPSFRLTLWVVLPTAILVGGGAAYVVLRAGQARRLPQQLADMGLLGEVGRALGPVGPDHGEVFVHGERWRAVADHEIPEGTPVVIRKVEGLTLGVEEAKP